MLLIEIAVIATMLILNALFAAYELALASVDTGRLREMAGARRPGAQAAISMKGRMEASLAVVQLGITLVGATAAAVGGVGADETIAPWLRQQWGLSVAAAEVVALVMVVLPLAGVTIIAGELVPKTLAIKNAEWVCLKLSPAMKWFAISVYPVVLALEWATRLVVRLIERRADMPTPSSPAAGMNQLLVAARAMRLNQIISAEQARVIEGAGRLSEIRISDILVPPAEIRALWVDGPLTEHLITVHLEAHTRFLVTAKPGDAQAIIGYVNVKDLFFLAKTHPHNPNLREITRPLVVVPPDARIGEALRSMMSEHTHLALVRDGQDQVLGMITLEDVLEEVVGDIRDEFDRLPRTLTPAGRRWVVGGGVQMLRLRAVLERPDLGFGLAPDKPVSDWIMAAHGAAVKAGDSLVIEGVSVLIRKMRRKKVMEALLEALSGGGDGSPVER